MDCLGVSSAKSLRALSALLSSQQDEEEEDKCKVRSTCVHVKTLLTLAFSIFLRNCSLFTFFIKQHFNPMYIGRIINQH